eukprot:4374516-Prymnesium_polylepis.1
MPPRYVLLFVAENTPLPDKPRGTERLATRALGDVIRMMDNFLVPRGADTTLCPFKAYNEVSQGALTKLQMKSESAARLLRGEPEAPPEPVSADVPATSKPSIEYLEEDS